MKIVLVRHGESEFNKQKIWQGTIDGNLSEKGLSDAAKVGMRLSKEKISALYTSKLKRAKSTVDQIAKYHNVKIIEEEGLNECRIELWDKCAFEEIQSRYANEYYEWQNNIWTQLKGVESMGNLQNRAVGTLLKIVENYQDEDTIVVISHSLVLRAIICWVLNLPLNMERRFHLSNASISIIEYNRKKVKTNGFSLLTLNDKAHL